MTSKTKILIAAVGVFLLAPLLASASSNGLAELSFLGKTGLPRGIRNNNPGNIRKGASAWKGKVQSGSDTAFEQFVAYVWGIRAMIKNLQSYQRSGLDTINAIIYKWAPPADQNDSAAYVKFVANRSGIDAFKSINLSDKGTMSLIVRAMCQMENFGGVAGKPEAVTKEQFDYAWSIL